MPIVTWDTQFEADPSDDDEAKYGANEIRTLKEAISERLELEMEFETGTKPLIKAGIASVLYHGNTTDINALTTPSNGAFAYDTDIKALKEYQAGWGIVDLAHDQFSNMANGDDHTQYLKLANKANQVLDSNLGVGAGITIGGANLSDLNDHVANHNMIGSWSNSGEYTHSTNYVANEDGFVTATGIVSPSNGSVSILTPSTVAKVINSAPSGYMGSMCPVKKGDDWRVDFANVSGNGIVYWIPLGT